MSLKRDYIYGTIIAVLVVVGLLRQCSDQHDNDKLFHEANTYKDSAKHYLGLHNSDIAYNKSLKLETTSQLKSILSKYDTLAQAMKKFKDISSVTIIKEKLVLSDPVKVPVQIPCDFTPIRVVRDSAKIFRFVGTISPNYFKIDSLIVPNTISIITGRKKTGLFKSELRAEVLNSNSMMKSSNVGSFIVKEEKKFYQRKWPYVIASVIAGAYLGHKVSK